MQNCCFALAIRQRSCQNGISRYIDNISSNIVPGSIISLEFGYKLIVISVNKTNITVKLTNPDFIPDLIFNIPNGNFKTFDLPQQGCSLITCIGTKQIVCPCECDRDNGCG